MPGIKRYSWRTTGDRMWLFCRGCSHVVSAWSRCFLRRLPRPKRWYTGPLNPLLGYARRMCRVAEVDRWRRGDEPQRVRAGCLFRGRRCGGCRCGRGCASPGNAAAVRLRRAGRRQMTKTGDASSVIVGRSYGTVSKSERLTFPRRFLRRIRDGCYLRKRPKTGASQLSGCFFVFLYVRERRMRK